MIRSALLIGTLALDWWGQQRQVAEGDHFRTFVEVHWGMWLWWVALFIAAGLLLGLSGLGSLQRSHRSTIALLISVPPALLLAHFVLLWAYAAPNDIHLPGVLGRPNLFMNAPSQSALALMLGVGLALGFGAVGPKSVSTKNASEGGRNADEAENDRDSDRRP